jgi:hypothetical protein
MGMVTDCTSKRGELRRCARMPGISLQALHRSKQQRHSLWNRLLPNEFVYRQ